MQRINVIIQKSGILYGQQPQTGIGPGVPDQIRCIILAGCNFNLCGEQCFCLIVSGNGAGTVQTNHDDRNLAQEGVIA